MSSNEILTLQFGHYSNFVGAHWWNLQEAGFSYDPDNPTEINHDVLFREGRNPKGEVTFTPRLLLVDLKGSLKALPEDGELYRLPGAEPPDESLEVHAQPPESPIGFQKDLAQGGSAVGYDLESEVRVWSDFLYTRFHPRTVNVVNEYQHSSQDRQFDIFPLGGNVWKSEQFSEDFADKIRNYIEECNSFQGFHVLLDCYDGFSGLATACLEHLQDEYRSKPVFSVPVNAHPDSMGPLQVLNTALCFEGLAEHSRLFTPLSARGPHKFKIDLPYQSSAVLAAALDTLTLNYRLKNAGHSLIDVCSDFSTNGRKAAATGLRLPFPIGQDDLIDCLDDWTGPLSQSLTPNCSISTDDSLQLVTLRGVPESQLKRPAHLAGAVKQRDMPAYRCESVKEMLEYFLACTSYGSRSEVVIGREKMPTKTPFPRFFVDEVESVSLLAGLHTGKFVGQVFGAVGEDVEKVKYKRLHQFAAEGVDDDQFRECLDRIWDLRDCYEDSYLV